STFENACPGNIPRLGERHRAMIAIVHDPGRTLVGSRFEIVHTQAARGTDDVRRIDAESMQFGHRYIGDGVVGQHGYKARRQSKGRERHCYIRLRTAKRRYELGGLEEALVPWRSEAQHSLAKCHYPHRASAIAIMNRRVRP